MSHQHDQKIALLQSVDDALANILPEKLQKIVRFGISGIVSTIFYFILVNVFVLFFIVKPVQASLYSYLLSLILSYLMQSRFTFRSFNDNPEKIARFVIAALLGLLVAHYGMKYVTESFNLHFLYGATLICVVIPVVNYILMNNWIFKDQKPVYKE